MINFKPDEIKLKLTEFYERIVDQKQQVEANKELNEKLCYILQDIDDVLIAKLCYQLRADSKKFNEQLPKIEARLECAKSIVDRLDDSEFLKGLFEFMIFVGIEEVNLVEEKKA